MDISTTVDIVEPIDKFSEVIKGTPGIGEIFNCGLEDWLPTHNYNLIWNQWCLGYLKDAQLLAHLKKCIRVLEPGGLIVVKENVSTCLVDIFDGIDSSVTRLVESHPK